MEDVRLSKLRISERMLLLLLRFYFNSLAFLNKKFAARQLIYIFSRPKKRVIRPKEVAIIDQAQKGTLLVMGNQLCTYQWGSGEKLALLVHGWESNAGSLGALVKPLLEQNYCVLAFDAAAHGMSQGKISNLIHFKSAIKAMIQRHGVPKLMIGHSLGANAIIMTCYEMQVTIDQVVLIAPLNRLMEVFEYFQDLLKIPTLIFKEFLSTFGNQTNYDLRDFYFHHYVRQTLIQSALLLHDSDDRITEIDESKTIDQNWEKSNLEVIHGSGHYHILWRSEVVEKINNFIQL